MDTVIIDSKGRLLDLDHYILKSDLDDEESSIFLFNRFDHSIDEESLDDLEVVTNYSFEAEGSVGYLLGNLEMLDMRYYHGMEPLMKKHNLLDPVSLKTGLVS